MIKSLTDIAPFLTDERAAGDFIAKLRWPDGVTCPFCGGATVWETTGQNEARRQWKCQACREKFSVTSRSIFEGSHIPLGKWIYAIFIMCSAKKGVSANQLKRELKLSYRSAWFLCHRIRHAVTQEPLAGMLRGVVEADETYVGGKSHGVRGRGAPKKTPVFSLIERGGRSRSFVVDDVKGKTLKGLIRTNVDGTAHNMTDSFASYKGLDKEFASHGAVDHNQEYVRGVIHTNFAESYFSLLKRGIIGSFHHVSRQHMPRYLAEFDHRWSTRKMTDGERFTETMKRTPGKRLMYRDPQPNSGMSEIADVNE
jgi:transposase-like protein